LFTSHHILVSLINNAGLIKGRIELPRVQYCINYENRELARKYLNEFVSIEIVRNKTDN